MLRTMELILGVPPMSLYDAAAMPFFRSFMPIVINDNTGGFFKIPHYDKGLFYFNCLATNGEAWEHLAVTVYQSGKRPDRCPTW